MYCRNAVMGWVRGRVKVLTSYNTHQLLHPFCAAFSVSLQPSCSFLFPFSRMACLIVSYLSPPFLPLPQTTSIPYSLSIVLFLRWAWSDEANTFIPHSLFSFLFLSLIPFWFFLFLHWARFSEATTLSSYFLWHCILLLGSRICTVCIYFYFVWKIIFFTYGSVGGRRSWSWTSDDVILLKNWNLKYIDAVSKILKYV